MPDPVGDVVDLPAPATATPSPGPTPPQRQSLWDLSANLMGTSTQLAERRAGRLESAGVDVTREAKEIKDLSGEQAATRETARPTPPNLTKPPSLTARPFLEPGDSVLGQVQSVMHGIGLLALGITGTKGRGYAMAATAALKGAAEGWQQGDNERVQRELAAWKTHHTHLMAEYQVQRDAFNDLLTNQKMTMQDRLAQLRIRAEVMGLTDLADQARQENISGIISYLQHLDKSQLDHDKVAAEIAHWTAVAEQAQRTYLATEAHRRETEARARESGGRSERRTRVLEETSGNVVKLQSAEMSLRAQLDNLAQLRDAIEIVDSMGAMAKGTTFWDKAQAAIALQAHPGDQHLAAAVETIRRFGTPALLKTEMSLGIQGSQLRVKSVIEAEAGNVLGIPRAFWDQFLPKAEARFREQLSITQQHLQRLNLLQKQQAPESGDVILETTP